MNRLIALVERWTVNWKKNKIVRETKLVFVVAYAHLQLIKNTHMPM
jgi:hypothetical protein